MRRILLFAVSFTALVCTAQKRTAAKQTLQYRITYAAPGINQIIILDTNNTFKMADSIESENPLITYGSWTASFNKLVLKGKDSGVMEYKIDGDQLVMLDERGKPSKSNSAKLIKKNLVSSKIYEDLLHELDFVAFGNEPSWSIDINHKTKVQVTLPGLLMPLELNLTKPILAGDSIIYNTGELKAVFYPGFCTDGFGANIYDYKALLYYQDKVFTGCASVLHQPTLEGEWMLQQVSTGDTTWKKVPFLQVDLNNYAFSGNAGCNIMKGMIRLKDNMVVFTDIFTTKMDCIGYNEEKFIDILVKSNRYEIEKHTLKLYNNDELLMTFVRR